MSEESHFYTRRRKLFTAGLIAVVVALVLLGALFVKKKAYLSSELKSRAEAVKAGPRVRIVTAVPSPQKRFISLVGEARPYASVTLYAKVSGYVREIRVDKGDRVKAGQILAVIESPEIDRQYEAALADAKNKRAFAGREKILGEKGYISIQEAEDAGTAARVAEANAEALKVQKGYETLSAPFPATVTARFVDPGALVQSAVSSQTTALPVVTLSQTDRLRVYIYVDQRDASLVRVGEPAEISDAARPEIRLSAVVSRITGELDQKTRTLLTELDLDNRRGLILPGSFVQVTLTMKAPPSVEVPANALMMREDKSFVAVVTAGNRLSIRPVVILYSDGRVVRVISGLNDGERVVLDPGSDIAEGQQVQPVSVNAK